MRKNSPRKWLHAILDLLPVILIPVFMVYSHRHTLTERTQVDIQYKYQSNEVNTLDDLIDNNLYCISLNPQFEDFVLDNDFYVGYIYFVDSNSGSVYESTSDDNGLVFYYDFDYDTFALSNDGDISVLILNTYEVYVTSVWSDYIDLFTLYGVLPQYTDFNVIGSVEVQDSNDNIMSVFAKDLSNTVDNYFNMNEVFNLGDVWTWINTNIFSGNAPLIASVVWNIIVYEFVIDLLFVFYGFFMFLIDFVDNMLDRPFNKGR